MATYIKPNAIKDASIEGIKIKDGTISSSKIDETVASKSYVDTQVNDIPVKKGTMTNSIVQKGNNAYGYSSSAFGNGTNASGQYTHTEGLETRANGVASHAEGHKTITENRAEHAEGTFNLPIQGKTIHTVGIGAGTSENDRKNAEEIHLNGDKYVFGIGGYDGTNSQTEGIKTVQEVVEETNTKIDNCVDLTSNQTIEGTKTFNKLAKVKNLAIISKQDNTEGSNISLELQDDIDIDPFLANILYLGDGNYGTPCRVVIPLWNDELKSLVPIYPSEVITNSYLYYNYAKLDRENVFTNNIVIKSSNYNGDALIIVDDNKHILSLLNKDVLKLDVSQRLLFQDWNESTLYAISIDNNKINFEHDGLPVPLNGIATPTANNDAANKEYVDTQVKAVDDKVVALEARATNAVQITYSELKSLRDARKLVPGTQYRITDYTCTTTQANTKSAGHVFDIIVTADDEGTLNEEARAALHSGDTYFANSNLSAWKLWYCLDNDSDRFAWADSTNGKGIIYRMIDEFNNDIPYDFKNIQFKHPNDDTTYPYYYYTFASGQAEDNTDYSLSIANNCYSNVIKGYVKSGKRTLNQIIFIGDNCYANTFGSNCYANSFVNNCYTNSFGNNCYSNTFRSYCDNNSFGNNCYANSFDFGSSYNSFGNSCSRNTFGNNYSSNSFGNDCSSNSFGYGCSSNSFGNNCDNNSFGNNCSNNTFGNNCDNIKFASDSSASNKYNYYYSNHFGDECQYILFTGKETASSSQRVQNYNFAQGLQGTSSAYLTIDGVRGRSFETYISKDTDGTIKESVIAEKLDKVIEISYNDLVTLRGSSKLVPGQQYRITDYTCTTAQEGTRSAGHQFDVIVTADSKNKLNENARAIQHTDDTYFANSKLESWELKYCLDNDTERFAWADTVNGKGVIYWMKDEYDNECPYDFKNIQFKRYAVTNVTSTKLTSEALNNLKSTFVKDSNGGLYFATKDSYGNFVPSDVDGASYEINENDSKWYYTFQGISSADGSTINKMYDLTVETFKLTDECISSLEGEGSGADTEDYCRENKIEQFNQEHFGNDIYYKGRQILNNIVFIGGLNYCYYNEENSYWEYNTSSIYGNRFGVNCNSNTFGNNCNSNTFGNYCYYNTFGNNCFQNTFGNSCIYNTFGNYCYYNTFGNYCYRNTFGNNCYSNTFGNNCYSNTFGNSCDRNTFGNSFQYNTFGNYFQESQFGDGVQYFSITTQQMTTNPTSSYLKNYIRWLIVENGVRYVNAYVTGSTSSSSQCQNVRICLGIQGINSNNRKTFDITSCINSKLNNVYQPENSQTTSV